MGNWTQDSRLKTQDSRLKTQDSRLKTQDSRLKTQDSVWFNGKLTFTKLTSGSSSVGRAQPCQGWGREFESRLPLEAAEVLIQLGT